MSRLHCGDDSFIVKSRQGLEALEEHWLAGRTLWHHAVRLRTVQDPEDIWKKWALVRREIHQVPIDALRLLDDQQISHRRATDAEVKAAHDQVRNPTPAPS